ncbi:MAG: hypothetical protein ACT4O1_09565 [Gemmatimonadota bacterium]
MPAWWRFVAAAVVATVLVGLRQQYRTNPLPGRDWPAAAELDSLAAFLRPVNPKYTSTESLSYPELMRDDPFDIVAFEVVEPEPLPAAPAPRARPVFKVTAILITVSDRIAVINSALVRVGAALPDGSRVVGIERDHVSITTTGGERAILRLNQGE